MRGGDPTPALPKQQDCDAPGARLPSDLRAGREKRVALRPLELKTRSRVTPPRKALSPADGLCPLCLMCRSPNPSVTAFGDGALESNREDEGTELTPQGCCPHEKTQEPAPTRPAQVRPRAHGKAPGPGRWQLPRLVNLLCCHLPPGLPPSTSRLRPHLLFRLHGS